jgi:hypothetical protein
VTAIVLDCEIESLHLVAVGGLSDSGFLVTLSDGRYLANLVVVEDH